MTLLCLYRRRNARVNLPFSTESIESLALVENYVAPGEVPPVDPILASVVSISSTIWFSIRLSMMKHVSDEKPHGALSESAKACGQLRCLPSDLLGYAAVHS